MKIKWISYYYWERGGSRLPLTLWGVKEGKMMEQVGLKLEENKVEDITHEYPYFSCQGKWGVVVKKDPFEVTKAKMTSTREHSWSSKQPMYKDVTHSGYEPFLRKTWQPESITENWMTGLFQSCWLVQAVGKDIWNKERWVWSEMSRRDWQWSFSREEGCAVNGAKNETIP